jgi:hypothetical protein
VFCSAKLELEKLELSAIKKAEQLEQEVLTREQEQQRSHAYLEASQTELVKSFGSLEAQVSSLGHIAVRKGDRLKTAEAQRQRANEAITLIQYIQRFGAAKKAPGDMSHLPSLFTDPGQVAQASLTPNPNRCNVFLCT